MATTWEELTHWKRPWCWEGFGAGGEGDDRGWDGWMASPTRWTWVWVNSGSWWWTGRPGVLWFMGSQRVGHNWATELNWTTLISNEVDFTSRKITRDEECYYIMVKGVNSQQNKTKQSLHCEFNSSVDRHDTKTHCTDQINR